MRVWRAPATDRPGFRTRVGQLRYVMALLTTAAIAASGSVDEWRIHPDHAGPAFIGMSIQQLSDLIGAPVSLPSDAERAQCFYAPHPDVKGLRFMLSGQRLARVDVDTPSAQTAEGARVGDSIARIESLYGDGLEKLPHKYLGLPDLYLTHRSADKRHAIRFETSGGTVSRFYAGRRPEVEYVEGCQ
jgi:hypothetical protein